jgi:hypothetical protein
MTTVTDNFPHVYPARAAEPRSELRAEELHKRL